MKFKFQFHGKCLAKEEVTDRVKLAVDEMHGLVGRISRPQYFVPLSSTQLQSFGAGAEQKPYRSSIIVYNKNDYFKLFPNVKYRETHFALKTRVQREYHNLLITKDVKDIGDHTALKFTRKPHQPLSGADARRCLKDYVEGVYSAIQILHNELGYAHLDIRIENICFNKDFNIVLIDLDRAEQQERHARFI